MQNPDNIVPANALTLSEAFELVFAMRRDAAELREAIVRTSVVSREEFDARFEADKHDEIVWSNHSEAWDAWDNARREVRKLFQDALLDGASLVAYQRDGATGERLRILTHNWDEPFMPDFIDESPPIFVLRCDVDRWLGGLCLNVPNMKKQAGRPPDSDYDRKELKELVYKIMEEMGGWFQDDLPGWQRKADLHKQIRRYYTCHGKKDPATSTLYKLTDPILDEWRKNHPSSSEN